MRKNGPKSAAELAVVTTIRPAAIRMSAPKHLAASAKRVWLELVASRPADYFDAASGPLLETLATATAEHRRLQAAVAKLDPIEDIDTLAKLTRLMDAHALRIGSAATKLRLSNQSRWDSQKASTLARTPGTTADRVRANYGRGA